MLSIFLYTYRYIPIGINCRKTNTNVRVKEIKPYLFIIKKSYHKLFHSYNNNKYLIYFFMHFPLEILYSMQLEQNLEWSSFQHLGHK